MDGSWFLLKSNKNISQQSRLYMLNYEGDLSVVFYELNLDKPTVKITPMGEIRVRTGDNITVTCSASGQPKPKLQWLQPPSIQSRMSRLRKMNKSHSGTLQVTFEVRPDDFGRLECSGSNLADYTKASVPLIVMCK